MSVINQMLNGLEQRGVPVEGDQVRTVREVRDFHRVKIALIVVLLVVLAGLIWFKGRAEPVALQGAAHVALPETAPEAAPVKQPVTVIPHEKLVVKAVPRKIPARQPATEKHPAVKVHSEKPPVHLAEAPPVKQISMAQQADGEYRRAAALMQQGHNAEARAGFEAALRLDAGHLAARQSLVAMLLEGRRGSEAEQLLQDGLSARPENSGFAMLLARLQIQRNDLGQAIATLEATLPYALQQAEYRAFYAALLQRKNRHGEAVEHYQVALKSVPDSGVWLMGYAISLQVLSRTGDAKEAYQRALDSRALTPELQVFVQQKLKGL